MAFLLLMTVQYLHLFYEWVAFLGKCVPFESIQSAVQTLKNKSPVAAENFSAVVDDIDRRWDKLLDGIFEREVSVRLPR